MWLDITKYNKNDLCPICHEDYGTELAIYKTPCNHMFHNNCLNQYCEHKNGDIVCPVCRSDIDSSCIDVWAYKKKDLSNPDGTPLFDNEHVYEIYNSQEGGRKKRRQNKTKSRKNYKKRKQNKRRTIRKRK